MKLLSLIIFLFLCIAIQAMIPGTIILNNGTEKKGLLERYIDPNEKSIRFKKDESSAEEKIPVEEIKKIVFNLEDGGTLEYYRKRVFAYRPGKNEFKDAGKDGLYILDRKMDGLGYYVGATQSTDRVASRTEFRFYISNDSDDNIYLIGFNTIPTAPKVKYNDYVSSVIKEVFDKSCPELDTKMQTYGSKKLDYMETIFEEYQKVCIKK